MAESPNEKCPSRLELKEFAGGDMPELQLERLSCHVERCTDCGEILDRELQAEGAGLVSALRAATASMSSDFEGEGPGIEVPETLVKVASDLGDPAVASMSFDAGRRLANRLQDGPVRLGRFELQSELGVGSFGYVFKAQDTELNRDVAIKVQRAGSLASDEDIERFIREAQSIAQLNHPGIVAVYDTVRCEDEVCYLVTEYVDGDSLESSIASTAFSPREAARVVAAIADALHYAHQQGIVHRDVKPSNILIDENGRPHIMDFGLAKRDLEPGNTMTSLGRVMGTPAYMSPEQASGDSSMIDSRSDVYSLGVVLYELITGERPFQGNRRMLLLQVLEDDPRPPRQLRSEIPKDLQTICLKAMAKSPNHRYWSANELASDLKRFMLGDPIKARPAGVWERMGRWCRRYPLAASLLVVAPLVSVGGFVYLSWLSTHFVQSTALESTRMEANMLEDINEFYSEQIIDRLDHKVVPATHEYLERPNTVPLPFTFMIDAGRKITEDQSGMKVKIYSEHPWRKRVAELDAFELRASEALSCRNSSSDAAYGQDRDQECGLVNASVDERSYHEFAEVDGEPVLRYARAQVMQQSCVNCHNEHTASPRTDWNVGEVGGVLSITRPLRRDIESTRSGLRSAFYLIACIAVVLAGLTLIVFRAAQTRSASHKGILLRADA